MEFMLGKAGKIISHVACSNLFCAIRFPDFLNILDFGPASSFPVNDFHRVVVQAQWRNEAERREWFRFIEFMYKFNRVGICEHDVHQIFILPPSSNFTEEVVISYRALRNAGEVSRNARITLDPASVPPVPINATRAPTNVTAALTAEKSKAKSNGSRITPVLLRQDIARNVENFSPNSRKEVENVSHKAGRLQNPNSLPFTGPVSENMRRVDAEKVKTDAPDDIPAKEISVVWSSNQELRKTKTEGQKEAKGISNDCKEKFITHARTHPEYLESISEMHSRWIFGALAELIDNARDAGANRVDICISMQYFQTAKDSIPVLSVEDNGVGMTHNDVMNMLTFGGGGKRSQVDSCASRDIIGRYGVGFKTGAMRLGKDALVLTQSKNSRSIALLSRSFNQGKDEVEIPMVSYIRHGEWMDIDSSVYSREEAEENLKAIKHFTPFNEYAIGQKFASLGEGTGTKIFIFNLDRWGDNFTLQWDEKDEPKSTTEKRVRKRDIWIRSRRVQGRTGQLSQNVPLDYSLHSYLEVIFIFPRMKMFVQGSPVRVRPLAKSLKGAKDVTAQLFGKPVQLTLGTLASERKHGNSGIFLYWHGRLIEAYKRVGGMLHSADWGRGVIGVIDVTDILVDRHNGRPLVLNNKQGFKESEEYAVLEKWLGEAADQYCDENVDPFKVDVLEGEVERLNDWIRCDKCAKWRMLELGVGAESLPDPWFCFMEPYEGNCSIPEQRPPADVCTTGVKRYYNDSVPLSPAYVREASLNHYINSEENDAAAGDAEGVVSATIPRAVQEHAEVDEDEEDDEILTFKRYPKRPAEKTQNNGKGLNEPRSAETPDNGNGLKEQRKKKYSASANASKGSSSAERNTRAIRRADFFLK